MTSIGSILLLLPALVLTANLEKRYLGDELEVDEVDDGSGKIGMNDQHFTCGFNDEDLAVNNVSRSAVSKIEGYKWSEGKVPYYFDGHVTENDKKEIRRVMKIIEDRTCARFEYIGVDVPTVHSLGISFANGARTCRGPFSGKVWPECPGWPECPAWKMKMHYNRQLADHHQCNWESKIIHEFMHVFGVMHTQKRADREEFLEVNEANLVDDEFWKHQFSVCDDCEIKDVPYECHSVMHYARSRNAPWRIDKNIPVMIPRKDCNIADAGKRATENDWKLLNLILECSDSVSGVCVNDDSTGDRDGDTCTEYYDKNPGGCGKYDTATFTASIQCCACGGGITGTTSICPHEDEIDATICQVYKEDGDCTDAKWAKWMANYCAKTCKC